MNEKKVKLEDYNSYSDLAKYLINNPKGHAHGYTSSKMDHPDFGDFVCFTYDNNGLYIYIDPDNPSHMFITTEDIRYDSDGRRVGQYQKYIENDGTLDSESYVAYYDTVSNAALHIQFPNGNVKKRSCNNDDR